MLPDGRREETLTTRQTSQCTYRCVVLPDLRLFAEIITVSFVSQCTYRCVVLPDARKLKGDDDEGRVSMHLQVRGAP